MWCSFWLLYWPCKLSISPKSVLPPRNVLPWCRLHQSSESWAEGTWYLWHWRLPRCLLRITYPVESAIPLQANPQKQVHKNLKGQNSYLSIYHIHISDLRIHNSINKSIQFQGFIIIPQLIPFHDSFPWCRPTSRAGEFNCGTVLIQFIPFQCFRLSQSFGLCYLLCILMSFTVIIVLLVPLIQVLLSIPAEHFNWLANKVVVRLRAGSFPKSQPNWQHCAEAFVSGSYGVRHHSCRLHSKCFHPKW